MHDVIHTRGDMHAVIHTRGDMHAVIAVATLVWKYRNMQYSCWHQEEISPRPLLLSYHTGSLVCSNLNIQCGSILYSMAKVHNLLIIAAQISQYCIEQFPTSKYNMQGPHDKTRIYKKII